MPVGQGDCQHRCRVQPPLTNATAGLPLIRAISVCPETGPPRAPPKSAITAAATAARTPTPSMSP